LWRYDKRDWRHHLLRAAQQAKFHATLAPRLDREIEKVNQVIDLEIERNKHEEPTPEQTGDSRLLGGPMSISSPWNDDDPEPPAAS
jgi:hypothetical protein